MSIADPQYNPERQLAKEFVLYTNRHVFLTGKAGTGKTTLLKEILDTTEKNYVVAAPTGVAAINAGGVTLHSLFLLPLKTFVPVRSGGYPIDYYCDADQLVKHQKFNRAKLDLIQELELLVIDEISMVRADILDAIDHTLRRVRRSPEPFGGVQLLVIGDLFQLAPVVKSHTEEVLSQFYKNPYFFTSLGWQKTEAVTIELKKVYRQEEEAFLLLLNKIRAGIQDQSIVDRLNQNYTTAIDHSDTIMLTTHNRKADKINSDQLGQLDSKAVTLTAKVTGKFPENAYPTIENMQLKVGAQVMFVRNHPEELYYNGKIGTITSIKESLIKVKVGNGHTILVEPIEWTNSRYNVDAETGKIIKEDIGSFVQHPLRLAWAVTVHKSQGLTFDKVILDLEDTFATGQLYVALSRCRSLAGMILSTRISVNNILTDKQVVDYTEQHSLTDEISDILEIEKATYEFQQLKKRFNFSKLTGSLENWEDIVKEKDIPSKADCLLLVTDLKSALDQIIHVGQNFMHKLETYKDNDSIAAGYIEERSSKAIAYFTEQLDAALLAPINKHQAEFSVKPKTKIYLREVEAIEAVIIREIKKLYTTSYLGKPIYEGTKKDYVAAAPKKKVKKNVGETYDITYNMHAEGKSIAAIAKERSLAESTIESHIGRLIRDERLSVFDLMPVTKVDKIIKIAEAEPDLNLTELITRIPFKISFGQLRWVTNHMGLGKS